jgi:hypothetical protein
MKNIKLSFFGSAIILFAMVGCQKEELLNPEKATSPSLHRDAATCATKCIDADGPYFELSSTEVVYWGGQNQTQFSKTGTLTVHNTLTHLVFVVNSTDAIADLVFDGVSTGLGAPANTNLTYSIALPTGWQACDIQNHTLKLAGNGNPVYFTSAYYLVGECVDACEYEGTSLTGTVTNATNLGNGSWQFTVTYTVATEDALTGVKTQGGLTAGGNQGVSNVVASAGATVNYNNNNAVVNWTDDFAACTAKTYTVTFERVFSGSGVITGDWSSKLSDGTVVGSANPLAY